MIAFHLYIIQVRQLHNVVVVGICISSSYTEYDTFFLNVSFDNGLYLMSIERFDSITCIGITVRVLFEDYIDGTPHCRAAEFGRYYAFVHLDTVYHIDRYIVDVDKIGIVVQRRFVDEESYAFALQPANREACSSSYSARRT